jgi:hypothetical protein
MKPFCTSCCWRSTTRSCCASRASGALLGLVGAVWMAKSAASMSASSSPFLTPCRLPASTWTTLPATSAPIFGSIRASSVPRVSSVISIAPALAWVTVISAGGGPAASFLGFLAGGERQGGEQ